MSFMTTLIKETDKPLTCICGEPHISYRILSNTMLADYTFHDKDGLHHHDENSYHIEYSCWNCHRSGEAYGYFLCWCKSGRNKPVFMVTKYDNID